MYKRVKKTRSFSTTLIKSWLKQGKLLDIIELRTGKNNALGNISTKLTHLDIICDNLDTDEKINWKDYVYLIETETATEDSSFPAYFYRASIGERIHIPNHTNISKFIHEWRKTNKNILYSRGLIIIPKTCELGVLYKFYNCNFLDMLENTEYSLKNKENI